MSYDSAFVDDLAKVYSLSPDYAEELIEGYMESAKANAKKIDSEAEINYAKAKVTKKLPCVVYTILIPGVIAFVVLVGLVVYLVVNGRDESAIAILKVVGGFVAFIYSISSLAGVLKNRTALLKVDRS